MNQSVKALINSVIAAKTKAVADVKKVESAFVPRVQLYVHTNFHPLLVGVIAGGVVMAIVIKLL